MRILWDARIPFLVIVAIFVAGAALITAVQRPLYASQALLSIKPDPALLAESIRTNRPMLGPDGRIYDTNDPDRQTGPGRYAPRLAAPGFVTECARDAGILTPEQTLDQRQAAAWVEAERIEGSDLIKVTVWQPTAEAAHKLATAIVERGLADNRRDQADVKSNELRRELKLVDAPTRPAAPSYPRRDLNLSSGFVLGLVAGVVFVVVSEIIRRGQ